MGEEERVYSRKSLINIGKDKLILKDGEVVQDGSTITLGKKSRCGIVLNYAYANHMTCTHFKIAYRLDTKDPSTRYSTSIEIMIKIQYYSDSGTAGVYGIYSIYPYIYGETDGYISEYEIPINGNNNIKSVYVEFRNASENPVLLNTCNLFNSRNTQQVVSDSFGFQISLSKIIAYADGCEIYYDNEEQPTKMLWQEDAKGDFCGIKVNKEKLIKFERRNEILLD